MKTIIVAVILSAAVAFATASWVNSTGDNPSAFPSSSDFNAELPAAQRIVALEQAISQERLARQLLQEEVIILTEELEILRVGGELQFDVPAPDGAETNDEPTRQERRDFYRRRNSPEGRTERLVDAGFDVGMANWVVQREQELQMESLQARYAAGRNGDPADYYRDQFSTNDVLREELGDADYERYLEANGRSTSVGVSSVIGSSPAQTAGLQAGDEITRYDGARVFSMNDITKATMAGEPGQTVVVDVLRDGIIMQVVMPRGPLGITGGRTRR